MNMLETPVQKRKRKQMLKAYELYKKYESDKGVYRIVADNLCVSSSTVRRWVELVKEQDNDNRDTTTKA